MTIKIYGPGCSRCHELERRVRRAVEELGVPAEVQKISDFKEIAAAGVIATPGLAVDGRLKSTGRIPTLDEIKAWIQEGA